MAAAYAYADGGPVSKEIELFGLLDHYGGAVNVLGRVLGAGEMRRMNIAQNVCTWYKERETAENVAEWTESNVDKANVLNISYRYAVELGLLEE